MNYKYQFFDDYSEGAHPRILEALQRTNTEQTLGYGLDHLTTEAAKLIQERIGNSEADIYFVSSGTQANLVSISWLLRPYEAVIAADSGHINLHETGAIEATGHKVLVAEPSEGKLTVPAIQKIVDFHNFDQMVKPRAVYISQSTEIGTVYTKKELTDIKEVCEKNGLYLYIDGARLGHGLTAEGIDLDIKDLANLTDIFYIGGTKNGGLIGEAIVITNSGLKENFRFHLRQRGALLAKPRSVSVQFTEFFKDNLYFEVAKHANDMAQKLAQGIKEEGYEFMVNSPTNQIFPIFPNTLMEQLKSDYGFHVWQQSGPDKSIIRLVCSWATPEIAIEEFIANLKKLNS